MEWEMIDGFHFRLKVLGGWVFKVMEDVVHHNESHGMIPGWDWRPAICFIPDPNHEWIIIKEVDTK
jgi:hypothetical protein